MPAPASRSATTVRATSSASQGSPPGIPTTDKQIAGAVRFGRKVTFHPVDNNDVTGYVAGWDKFNYFVLVPNEAYVQDATQPLLRMYLVHKGNSPIIELHNESTFDKEDPEIREALKQVSSSFRQWVLTNYFPQAAGT